MRRRMKRRTRSDLHLLHLASLSWEAPPPLYLLSYLLFLLAPLRWKAHLLYLLFLAPPEVQCLLHPPLLLRRFILTLLILLCNGVTCRWVLHVPLQPQAVVVVI